MRLRLLSHLIYALKLLFQKTHLEELILLGKKEAAIQEDDDAEDAEDHLYTAAASAPMTNFNLKLLKRGFR